MTSARIKQLRIFFHAISALPSILYVMGLLRRGLGDLDKGLGNMGLLS